MQHALLVEDRQAGSGQAPHRISLRAVFFGQQHGGDDAGGIAYPLDLDIRIGLFEGLLVALELFGFKRGINRQLGVSGSGLQTERSEDGSGKSKWLEHDAVPLNGTRDG
ncbi:hypothetical protein D9M71_732750 [compost metagenome]